MKKILQKISLPVFLLLFLMVTGIWHLPAYGAQRTATPSNAVSAQPAAVATPSNAGQSQADVSEGRMVTRPAGNKGRAAGAIGMLKLGTSDSSGDSWSWVADSAAQKGTLTLTDCHIVAEKQAVEVPQGWEVTIVLKGTNVLESTNTTYYGPLFGNTNISDNLWIIQGDGRMELSSESGDAYGFTGYSININSGDILSDISFCMILNDFSMEDGSLEVHATSTSTSNGIYTDSGPVNIQGGKLKIEASQAGIFLPGVQKDGTQEVCISGGEIDMEAGVSCIWVQNGNGSSQSIVISGGSLLGTAESQAGLYAQNISITESPDEDLTVQITTQAQPAIRARENLSVEGGEVTAKSSDSFGLYVAGNITIADTAEVTAVGKIDGSASVVEVGQGAVLNGVMRTNSAKGQTWTVYGDAELHSDLTLGPKAFETASGEKLPVTLVITQGAKLTVPQGVTLDAASGITEDTLGQYLVADETTIEELTKEAGIVKLPGSTPIRETVAAPVITPLGGTFEKEQLISISCATEGANIYYTTDGSSPTAGSLKYTGNFTITGSTVIKAIGVKEGMDNSQTAIASFTKSETGNGKPSGSGESSGGGDTPGSGNGSSGGVNGTISAGGSSSGSSDSDDSWTSGSWKKDSKGWRLRYPNGTYEAGTYVKGEDGIAREQISWKYKDNAWWAFGAEGYLKEGWVLDRIRNCWYYIDTNKGMKTGWHLDSEDGLWYYLKPGDGHMVTGWNQIEGNWYYMNESTMTPAWRYSEENGKWSYNGTAQNKPFGAMYKNEQTPDGYMTDETGKRIE